MAYPNSLDNIPIGIINQTESTTAGIGHTPWHNAKTNAINALETKVGINNSADTTSIDYKVNYGLQQRARTVTNAPQALPNNVTTKLNTLVLGTDPTGMWDPVNYRFIAPFRGWYEFWGQINFQGVNTSGIRQAIIVLNSSTGNPLCFSNAPATIADYASQTSSIAAMNANDYVELWAYQNSGGSLNTQDVPSFAGTTFSFALLSRF